MNIELRIQEYTVDGMHISLYYKNGDIYDITIQQKDGEVLFSGSFKELEEMAGVTHNILAFLEEIK